MTTDERIENALLNFDSGKAVDRDFFVEFTRELGRELDRTEAARKEAFDIAMTHQKAYLKWVAANDPGGWIWQLRDGLENCRLYAARHRDEEWAQVVLRFCRASGAVGVTLRASDCPVVVVGGG